VTPQLTCVARRVKDREHWQNRAMEKLLPVRLDSADLDAHSVSFPQRLALSLLEAVAANPNLLCARLPAAPP